MSRETHLRIANVIGVVAVFALLGLWSAIAVAAAYGWGVYDGRDEGARG